ncbi:hypothetical protein ACQP1G_25350 [Nocardia sp. CA-107356]|uniref:hypothetical protein n=1 Tax=Nocardia sp. CA-107356 TaxID=3239972 RepID=UPI003D92E589
MGDIHPMGGYRQRHTWPNLFMQADEISHTRKDTHPVHLIAVIVLTAVIAGLLRWLVIRERRRSLIHLPNGPQNWMPDLVYAQLRPMRLRGPFIALTALWSALLITEIATNPDASNVMLYVYSVALVASAVNLTTMHLRWRFADGVFDDLARPAGR